jgi:hypothetical protein
MRPTQIGDLQQRPTSTLVQLVHTEDVIPLSSMEGQVIGSFTALADYSWPTPIAWSGELQADLPLSQSCSILSR